MLQWLSVMTIDMSVQCSSWSAFGRTTGNDISGRLWTPIFQKVSWRTMTNPKLHLGAPAESGIIDWILFGKSTPPFRVLYVKTLNLLIVKSPRLSFCVSFCHSSQIFLNSVRHASACRNASCCKMTNIHPVHSPYCYEQIEIELQRIIS